MSASPALTLDGRPEAVWLAICAGLPALAVVAWTLAADVPGLILLAPPLAMASAWFERRRSTWQLAWDGQLWTLDGAPGTVRTVARMGDSVLLAFCPAGRSWGLGDRWLAKRAGTDPQAWQRFRMVLEATSGAAAPASR
ncbi:MAG: hypothetical protein ACOVOT_02060 [Rubrivivax sp.]|jgi:hypothetical protein|nr:hypothetical protein [Rubrivivax sp.]